MSLVRGAARIEKVNSIDSPPERSVGMAEDNKVDVPELFPDHLLLNVNLVFPMDQPDRVSADGNDLLNRKFHMDLGIVHIAGNSFDGRNCSELIKHRKLDYITGMEDKVHSLEDLEYSRRKRRHNGRYMGIRKNAYFHYTT